MGKGKYEPTDLERARDELFSHIQRCNVLEATPDQQQEWLEDTVEYLSERYPALSRKELAELKQLGDRYCSPAIPHGDVVAEEAWSEQPDVEETEDAVQPEAVDQAAVEARPAPDAEVPAS